MKRKLSPFVAVFLLLMASSALAELSQADIGEIRKLVGEETKTTTEATGDTEKEIETPRKQREIIAEKLGILKTSPHLTTAERKALIATILKETGFSEALIKDSLGITATSEAMKWYWIALFVGFLSAVIGSILYMGYKNLERSVPIQNIAELPWALPKGSIRATLTLIVTVGIVVLILGKVPVPELLKDAFLVIIAFYFGSRKLTTETEVKERPSVDAAKSTLAISDPAIPADETTTSTITVTPKDDKGNNLGSGHNVSIKTTLGELQGNVQDRGDGTYVQDIRSPKPGKATIIAKVNGIELQAKGEIDFTSSVDAAKSTLAISDPAIPADETTTSTITVTPKDDKGNNLGSGHNVSIKTTLGELQGNVQDRGDGTYVQDIRSPKPGKATIIAKVNGIELQAKGEIDFTSIE